MTKRAVLRRYWLLCVLFGVVFGIRYTLDVWVIVRLAGPEAGWNSKFAYVLASLTFMLFGELLGAAISDYRSRVLAVTVTAPALLFWAFAAGAAVLWAHPFPLLLGAAGFGLGFGLYHSSLEAWVDDALDTLDRRDGAGPQTGGRRVTELQIYWGSVLVNFGVLASSAVAFPLLIADEYAADLRTVSSEALRLLPYSLAAAASFALLVVRPGELPQPEPTATPRPNPVPLLTRLARGYREVLTSGATVLFVALFLGGSVSLLIQYIDHFAPAEMIPGDNVAARTQSLLIYNGIICGCTAAVGWLFEVLHYNERLGHAQRSRIIALILALVLLSLLYLLRPLAALDDLAKAVLIGLTQSALLVLPPLIKAWTLDYATGGLRGTVQSLLGVSKRLFGIVATLLIWFTVPHNGDRASDETVLYGVLAFIVMVCLGMLGLTWLRARPR